MNTSQKLRFTVELEQEDDDRWLASVPEYPGVSQYAMSREYAAAKVVKLALDVIGVNERAVGDINLS